MLFLKSKLIFMVKSWICLFKKMWGGLVKAGQVFCNNSFCVLYKCFALPTLSAISPYDNFSFRCLVLVIRRMKLFFPFFPWGKILGPPLIHTKPSSKRLKIENLIVLVMSRMLVCSDFLSGSRFKRYGGWTCFSKISHGEKTDGQCLSPITPLQL